MEECKLKEWVAFQFLVKNPYRRIGKGSLVTIDGEEFVVSRIDSIVLLDSAVKEPNTVQVFARGNKRK